MDETVERWWLYVLRGVAAVIFGVLTFVAPSASLFALVLLFGVYAFVDGSLHLTLAVRAAQRGERWGTLLLGGLAGVIAGVLAFVWPGISALVLLLVIAAWAVITGAVALAAAIAVRGRRRGAWLLGSSGVLAIGFGVLMAMFPGAGAVAVVYWIGAWALVYGVLLMAYGLHLMAIRSNVERRAPGGALPSPV